MNLKEFFEKYPRVAVAFSGGVDSAYLLYMAKKYAKEVKAYYVKSDFQPEFEFNDAKKLAEELDADLHVIYLDVLSFEDVKRNPSNRCYYCKMGIFTNIKNQAIKDGFAVLLDGTNASDDAGDRPGMKALEELKVLSPLRECGLTKDEIRKLSKEAGLFTWDKPAYACLATRIPTGEVITKDKLQATERAEDFLFKLGFTDFRVRSFDGHARIEISEDQVMDVFDLRNEILEKLKNDYKTVSVSLEVR